MTQGFENISDTEINWSEVQEYVGTGELYKLRRSKDETVKYRAHKAALKEKNIEMIDHILGKLDWNLDDLTNLNDNTYPTINDKIEACFSQKDLFKLLPNDFPYMFESNIIHILVWSKIQLPLYLDDKTEVSMENQNSVLPTMYPPMKDKIERFLENTLTEKLKLKPDTDFVWFLNYSNLQSIKGISHVHLLIRFKEVPPDHSETTKIYVQEKKNSFINDNIFLPFKC